MGSSFVLVTAAFDPDAMVEPEGAFERDPRAFDPGATPDVVPAPAPGAVVALPLAHAPHFQISLASGLVAFALL